MQEKLNELALFAGAGGGILGGILCGFRTVCAVEYDDYARRVLMARQDDGCLDPFPVWDDVRTFDGKPWRGLVDIITGGFPCQDISVAGTGKGLDGEKSGLWREMARIIGEVGPRFVLVENSPALAVLGGTRVTGDLASMGYDARWGVVGGCHTGAPHDRERMWIVAYAISERSEERLAGSHGRDEGKARVADNRPATGDGPQDGRGMDWWASEPSVGRMVHGLAHRAHRLRCLGNGQVPAVVPLAWNLLKP
jgi:DNA (cytosine-5)-methyltransferase 1